MLHGIELAKPDEYYGATAPCEKYLTCKRRTGRACDKDCKHPKGQKDSTFRLRASACLIPGYEAIDVGIDNDSGVWVITCGVSGAALAHGATRRDAIAALKEKLDSRGVAEFERLIIGWLETHPLSPRYRWVTREVS